MNMKILIPLCAAAALFTACSDRNNDTGVGGESTTGTPDTTAPDSTTTSPDSTGGTSDMPPADPNATPGTTSTPGNTPPPDTTSPDAPPPTNQ
jgi:hypothetical protein